jgi:predicted choloylglycine hydrolase
MPIDSNFEYATEFLSISKREIRTNLANIAIHHNNIAIHHNKIELHNNNITIHHNNIAIKIPSVEFRRE